jgi:hypothetical protein
MSVWRVAKNGGKKENCGCPEVFVKPNGDVHICGCRKSPKLGNILTGFQVPSEFVHGECYQKQPEEVFQEIIARVA